MPYNTRRKSVSLASLGIHVPNSSRSSSHRSPPATAASSAPTPPAEDSQPPSKRVKRSHTSGSPVPLSPVSPVKPSPPILKDARPRSAGLAAEFTPPPEGLRIDTEGINDEIVVGVIEQLEKTGNRPHLLKELAAILQHTLPIVQSSANQPAIISSRLATYMKRQWTALSPCPLGKELVGTHPKRIYFFLTTQPRQNFPDPPERADAAVRIITPSLTSAENEEEDKLTRGRAAMSPSPDVDLSAPELEHYDSPLSATEYYNSTSHVLSQVSTQDSSTSSLPLHGQINPPLEGDEREFTQTATSLQQRRKSESMVVEATDTSVAQLALKLEPVGDSTMDDSEESRAHHDRSDSAALFGHGESHLSVAKTAFMESSPMLRPQTDVDMMSITYSKPDLHEVRMVDDFSCFDPECVDMDELDELFAKY